MMPSPDSRNPGDRGLASRLALRCAVLSAAALATLLSAPLPVRAAAPCGDVAAILRRAYPTAIRSGDGFDLKGAYARHVTTEAVACKVWPADPSLVLVAVPLIEAHPTSDDETRGDVEILVLGATDGRPLARRVERGMAVSDAIRFSGVTLDTARYDIRPGTRAFGLRTEQNGSSRVNPYSEQALWLYTVEDGRIARVLDGLIVERVQGENDGNCTGGSRTVRRAVSLGAETAQGYRDLAVDQTETIETAKMVDRQCRSTQADGARARQVLRFADGRYVPPAALRPQADGTGSDWFSLIMSPEPVPAPVAAGDGTRATGAPSFDCAKARSPVEKAICASPALAKADAEVDRLYRQTRGGLAPAAAALLTKDERAFMAAREGVFDAGAGAGDPAERLLRVLAGRADFLRSLRVPQDDGLAGSWGNVASRVTVTPAAGGRLAVDVNGSTPVTARWICGVQGTGQVVGGVLTVALDDGSALRLRRDGQVMDLEAVPPPAKTDWRPEYCGLNGSVEGRYFAVSRSK